MCWHLSACLSHTHVRLVAKDMATVSFESNLNDFLLVTILNLKVPSTPKCSLESLGTWKSTTVIETSVKFLPGHARTSPTSNSVAFHSLYHVFLNRIGFWFVKLPRHLVKRHLFSWHHPSLRYWGQSGTPWRNLGVSCTMKTISN